jgi:hypothetical protein
VIVLVGHCTLKDCAVAGSDSTTMSTNTNRIAPAIFLDMRPPPPPQTASFSSWRGLFLPSIGFVSVRGKHDFARCANAKSFKKSEFD